MHTNYVSPLVPSFARPGGELGWDVFRMHYEVRGPLATLFTPRAMSQYLRVFQMLWRLKRAECDLAHSWKVLKCEVERTAAKFNRGEQERDQGGRGK